MGSGNYFFREIVAVDTQKQIALLKEWVVVVINNVSLY